jgi:hypothetical protein
MSLARAGTLIVVAYDSGSRGATGHETAQAARRQRFITRAGGWSR